MKVERFIKEYALYRIRELEDMIDTITDVSMEEDIIREIVAIRRTVRAREQELITVHEAMRVIMEV